ncbi:RNB-domain-containing protein [Atractiella rhizophila]|nr:RNB-domain-containing protein [Atractiella rhizophila]
MQITILPPSTTNTSFLRKTAKSKLHSVYREHYLRNDISCGFRGCTQCKDADGPLTEEARNWEGCVIGRHWVVLDTNVILHQFDLVEDSRFGADIIIPQTVLSEVRHRSLPLYYRLLSLVEEEATSETGMQVDNQGAAKTRGWIMWNEAHQGLWVEQKKEESANDRSDRAIRAVVQWYSNHLSAMEPVTKKRKLNNSTRNEADMPKVLLLSDDKENRRLAKEEGILAYSVREYVSLMPDERAAGLLDLYASSAAGEEAEGKIGKEKEVLYAEYLPPSVLQAGIKSGQLYQGHFQPSPYNFLEGSVNLLSDKVTSSRPVLLRGRKNMNRATAGDVVVVRILPEAEWEKGSSDIVDGEGGENDDPEEEEVEEQNIEEGEKQKKGAKKGGGDAQPTGVVVGVLKRQWRPYVAHIDRSSLPPSALQSTSTTTLTPVTVFATPVSRLIPRIRIRTRQAAALMGQKILVAIDRWDVNSKYPEGHFVRALGEVESVEGERESLLLEYDVPHRPFSKAVLGCLPKEGESWKVPPKEEGGVWKNREDLRHLNICSIDPPRCQDIDDALHAIRLPNGNIQAGVHIADVSHFVQPNNSMDMEAASRGTTVYLVDQRIDMLPSLLGTNLCSLRPFVERLAFSVIWELNEEADIVNVRFTKSVIASKSAFTYEEAQVRMDNPSLNDDITQSIRLLNSLAIKLKAKRIRAGALNLASPEVKIHMESAESTEPIDVEQKMLLQTNSLVEEFMLLANISVAERIYQQFPLTAVLRRHAPPPKTNFDALVNVLKVRKGLIVDVSSSKALADSLDACVDPKEPAFNTLVRIMATRCMLSAEYFCSGSFGKDAFRHYGLASPIYTHFTSPIRRYADVMAHRQLFAAISETPLHPSLLSKAHVERVMEVINKRHRAAQQAGRASVEFYVALSMRQRSGNESVHEEAFVIRTFKNGLAVFVSKFGLEGLIKFKHENSYDEEKFEVTISTPHGPLVIGVFDKIKVDISVEKDRNTQRGKVTMKLAHPWLS